MDTGVHEAVTGYPVKATRRQVDPNFRRDLFARVIVPVVVLAVLVALVLVGCGHQPSIREAVDVCRSGLVVVRVEAERKADKHARAAGVAVDRCRSELGAASTDAERAACMDRQGMGIAATEERERAFAVMGESYNVIAAALEEIERALPTLQRAEQVAEQIGGEQ